MRVLLIAQYFPPEIGAAASRWGDYVDILVQRGHKVTVLCGMPNYPRGKRFDGYNNLWVKRERKSSNLRIIRSAVWANDRKSTFKMLGNYLSFAFSGVINAMKIRNVDLIVLSSPPLFVGIIGMMLSSIRKYKMLLDVRDIWPESVVVLGGIKSKWLIKLGRLLESKVYRSASGYIFPVPGFQKYFKSHHPLQMKKPMFNLMNGVHEDFLVKTKETQLASQKDFTVLYSGNMGMAQGLEVVLEAASELKDYPIQFKLIGDGICKTSLIQMAKSMGLSNMTFLDSISREALISEMHNASVCLVPLKNNPLFRNAIPSKIFEIMACKKPVILGVEGEATCIIQQYNCGTVVSPENPLELKNIILKYFESKDLIIFHGNNGVRAVTEHLRKDVLLSTFLKCVNTTIN
ncbi:MAG: hypothetical protein CMG74_12040 [Candidatus Marinimicrobia bacterium]|nr:hypothetical protein [Candidatus Neomarinimicrobiota bacterium]|tara:strand:- start:5094 stop:6305 length:1212 start_codon:yes stop_codon:yes gene_type:complete